MLRDIWQELAYDDHVRERIAEIEEEVNGLDPDLDAADIALLEQELWCYKSGECYRH